MENKVTKTVLDRILGAPDVLSQLPTAKYKVDRLSEELGTDVVFTLQALPYGRAHDMERLSAESDIQILLAGCVDPDLKDGTLMNAFPGCVTPADAVKHLLLPGEIADLAAAVERLSGYRKTTITEVKNA